MNTSNRLLNTLDDHFGFDDKQQCQTTKRTDPPGDKIIDPPPQFSGGPLTAQQPALAGLP